MLQAGYYYMETYPNDTTLGTTDDYRTFHSARGFGPAIGGAVPMGSLAPVAVAPFY